MAGCGIFSPIAQQSHGLSQTIIGGVTNAFSQDRGEIVEGGDVLFSGRRRILLPHLKTTNGSFDDFFHVFFGGNPGRDQDGIAPAPALLSLLSHVHKTYYILHNIKKRIFKKRSMRPRQHGCMQSRTGKTSTEWRSRFAPALTSEARDVADRPLSSPAT